MLKIQWIQIRKLGDWTRGSLALNYHLKFIALMFSQTLFSLMLTDRETAEGFFF